MVTLEHVRDLFDEPENEAGRVTAATVTPDGRWIAVRSYRNLYLYRAQELLQGGTAEPTIVDLGPLELLQGESVAITEDGTVWLTSEAVNNVSDASWARLRCAFPSG